MQHSEQINEIAAALARAQGEIRGAIKDSNNPHFRSSYADLSSVWDACRAALSKNNIAVVQAPTTDDNGAVCVVTLLTHSSGQWMESELSVKPMKPDAQGVGSVITYLRRYSLAAMVGVAPEDDDGEAASGRGESNGNAPKMEPAKRANRGNGKPAIEVKVPDEPGLIPVPEDADMQIAWKAWVMALQAAVHVAPDLQTVNAWVDANHAPLASLKQFNAKTHDYIAKQIDARRGVLAQAPAEAA